MSFKDISGFITAEVDGDRILHQREIFNRIVNGFREYFVYIKVGATPGALIRTAPSFYLSTEITIGNTGSLERREITPTSRQDVGLPNILITDANGNKTTSSGYLNSFNSYPVVSISGFLFFKFPVTRQENVVSEIVEYRYA